MNKTSSPTKSIEKKKRKRTTSQQLRSLEDVFRKNKHPSAGLRNQLAVELSMSPGSVLKWFQNRRAKAKKKSDIDRKDEPTMNVPVASHLLFQMVPQLSAQLSSLNASQSAIVNDKTPCVKEEPSAETPIVPCQVKEELEDVLVKQEVLLKTENVVVQEVFVKQEILIDNDQTLPFIEPHIIDERITDDCFSWLIAQSISPTLEKKDPPRTDVSRRIYADQDKATDTNKLFLLKEEDDSWRMLLNEPSFDSNSNFEETILTIPRLKQETESPCAVFLDHVHSEFLWEDDIWTSWNV